MHRGDILILLLTLTFKDGAFDNGCVCCMLPLYVQAQPVISMSLFLFSIFLPPFLSGLVACVWYPRWKIRSPTFREVLNTDAVLY
jgi:hypothetical protein